LKYTRRQRNLAVALESKSCDVGAIFCRQAVTRSRKATRHRQEDGNVSWSK
jgi:hypothetical protein